MTNDNYNPEKNIHAMIDNYIQSVVDQIAEYFPNGDHRGESYEVLTDIIDNGVWAQEPDHALLASLAADVDVIQEVFDNEFILTVADKTQCIAFNHLYDLASSEWTMVSNDFVEADWQADQEI